MIYYALDNSLLHLHLARLSLSSLRRHNRSIAVRVVLFGVKTSATPRQFEKLGADVIIRKKPRDVPPMFLKWHALRDIGEDRAMYADADTFFFKDPAKTLDRFSSRDFYAREEYGTRPGIGYQLLGNLILEPQIQARKYKTICKALGFRPGPVFNTGVMIFNRGFTSRMAAHVERMDDLYRFFLKSPAMYPAENLHIADEVLSAMVFGEIPRFSWDRIPKEVSPWYCEWKAGAVTAPGVVMHSWSKYSPFFVREFAGINEFRRLPFLIPVESRYAEI